MIENLPRPLSSFGRLVKRLLDVETDDPVRLRRGRLVNVVLVVTLGITLVWLVVGGLLAVFSAPGAPAGWTVTRLVLMAAVLGATYALNRRSASPLAGLILAMAALAGSIVVLLMHGPLTPSVIGLTVPVLVAGLLGPPATAFLLATLAVLVYGWLSVQQDPAYLAELARGKPGADALIVCLNLYIIAALGWLFSRMAGRAIRESQEEIEVLVESQEALQAQLERHTLNLRATASVTRALAGSRELDVLLRNGVGLVQRFFSYDCVQIFLLDEAREVAVLRASSSEAGRELLARGHGLPVGAVSVVGQVAERGEAVIGGKADVDLLLQRVEHSPEMRSEVALPLMVGDEVSGVLHLQSAQSDAFAASGLPAMQALADQLAVAIANARLYEEAQRNLRELSELSREAAQRGWRAYLFGKSEEERLYRYGPSEPERVVRQEAIVKKVVGTGELVSTQARKDGAPGSLAVPMILRNEVIGVVGVEMDEVRDWTQDDVTIMQSIAERATLAVENARLLEQAHRTARREQLINTIAARLQRASSLRTLLEGVASELSEVLGTNQIYAEFTLHRPRRTNGEPPRGQDGDGSAQPGVSPNGDEADERLDDVQPREEDEDSRRNSQ